MFHIYIELEIVKFSKADTKPLWTSISFIMITSHYMNCSCNFIFMK